ncbi:MAG TPA: hypothetical protein VFS43_05640 [Polyangiaceae bacterium]|nr:hypothetical protein [Polyangiaceae bacterium]
MVERFLLGAAFGVGVALACGCASDQPAGASAEGTSGASLSSSVACPAPGTQVVFDPKAQLAGASFYDLPYPFDFRLSAQGGPDLSGMPHAGTDAALDLIPAARARPGFPSVPVGYFRLTGAPASPPAGAVMPADVDADVLLVDVDPWSSDWGKLYPTVAAVIPAGAFAPPNLLAVGAAPGVVLPAGRTYAFVLRRSFGDAAGAPLGVSAEFAAALGGLVPPGPHGFSLFKAFFPLRWALYDLGVGLGEVAGAAIFKVGDVVAETERLSSAVVAAQDVRLENVRLDPVDGASHPRFCELRATATMPQYQRGTQPFNTEGGFELDAWGRPVVQGAMAVPVTLTVPKGPMPPGGYPLVLYLHGSGGLSTQVVDRGRITTPGGAPTPGEGPAHVLAERGLATAGAALPLNPERLPGATLFSYINFGNLAALPSTFRQGVFEQRLLIEALSALEIEPGVLEGCAGVSLPPGAARYRFDLSSLGALGQSMGAYYLNQLGAVEPAVRALVPTGSGGLWNLYLVDSPYDLGGGVVPADVFANLMGVPRSQLSPLHPALTLLETAWEPGEPVVGAARVGRRPLPGHPVRHVYQPVGKDDEYFPPPIFDAMALGFGHRQAGAEVWASMQPALALEGYGGLVDYPSELDAASDAGVPRTSVVVQYPGDGIADPHTIFSQLDEVKYQYGCFFSTFVRTGRAVVPAPAPLGAPCPE